MEENETTKKRNLFFIKAQYTISNIFLLIDKKQKLRFLNYNKELQKLLNININDYQNMSGKHKIGGKNGIGKEYILLTMRLIFEGEYVNGKKNGKGKEYYEDDELKFEDEYINGKKWNGMGYYDNKIEYEIKEGKGLIKEHSIEDKSLFVGEYLNGEINGKVKSYDKYGSLIFKGYYLNGKRNEKGKEYYLNSVIFEGEYLNRKRSGKGKEYVNNILRFEGEYLNGEKNGKGKEYNEKGLLQFEGEYLNGKKWNGKGYNINGDNQFEIINGNG